MSALLEDLLGSGQNGQAEAAPKRVKGLAWARVSTDMQEERGLSIPEQLRQIREYADNNGIEIVDEFQEATSAFKQDKRRVEFHRMIDRAQSDKSINAILVHDYSRFSRDSLKARTLIRDLKQSGIKVVSLNDMEIDPETVAGVYMEAITFAKNEAYSREVAFHTRKGCRANVQTRDPETGWCYKNGGQPLWGYRAERLIRGEHRSRPIIKCIWVPDDTIVAGKPVHEWARHCLVELAAKGATLDQLRDFCNEHGIPASRQRYWGSTTWHSLLHPNALLQYAGYGVWNVRGRNRRWNPPSEWIVTEDAHPALITEPEAQRIMEARKLRSDHGFGKTSNRAQSSRYLLSGGLFVCARCGGSLVGFEKTKDSKYYVCNSIPNRRGLGCGPGVYVPQEDVEREVFKGLSRLLGVCTDRDGFVRKVNNELRHLWEQSHGYEPGVEHRLAQIDTKIANIRASIEDGLSDTQWANRRIQTLTAERDRLSETASTITEPPQIDAETAMAYRCDAERLFATGEPAEKKQFLRAWVDKITLAPETLEVEINYKIPEPVVDSMGAGGGFEPPTFGL